MYTIHIISTNALAGTERYLLDLVKSGDSANKFTIIYPGYGSLEKVIEQNGFEGVKLSFEIKSLPLTAFKLWKFLRKVKPDIVHTHLGKATLVGAPLAYLTGVRGIVTTLHFIRPAYASTHVKLTYPLFLFGHKLVNFTLTKMIAISDAVAQETMMRENVKPGKIVKIPHGTAFKAKEFTNEERVRARKELGIRPEVPVIVTVARLEKEKGHALLLDAYSSIIKENPSTQFLWVGEGDLQKKLEQQIKTLGGENHINLLGFREDIASLLALSDIFVLPAYEEPFGLAILEAMASGLPVIAINAGGPAEIVLDGETGRLVPPEPVDLAEAICELLADPGKAHRMGDAGRKRCETEYTVERMVRQTEELYYELINKKKKSL